MLVHRGLALVISDLAEMGYDCQWGIVSASDCGAPHQRDRIWIVGNTNDYGQTTTKVGSSPTQGDNSSKTRQKQASESTGSGEQYAELADTNGIPSKIRRSNKSNESSGGIGTGYARGGRADDCWKFDTEKNEIMADTSKLQCNGSNDNAGISMESGRVSESGNNGRESNVADTASERQQGRGESWFGSDPAEKREGETDHAFSERVGHIWGIESPLGRVANGVAARVDRLKAIGNGQVPIVAATAFKIIMEAR